MDKINVNLILNYNTIYNRTSVSLTPKLKVKLFFCMCSCQLKHTLGLPGLSMHYNTTFKDGHLNHVEYKKIKNNHLPSYIGVGFQYTEFSLIPVFYRERMKNIKQNKINSI